ncbi:hypothetical protein EKK58_10950 [Candidatus Dependentiae bacterium]|nr:MAG: hypothetical protein EKK58_10950 [Candidatus Dependentiae bacterium]
MLLQNKYSKLFFVLLTISCIKPVLHAAEFNPEHYHFSQKASIQNWLHPAFMEYLPEVQSIIGQSLSCNPERLQKNNVVHSIQNNDDDTRFYGKSFPILPVPLTILLRTINDLRKQKDTLTILEVGGANGLVVLLMAFAAGPKATLIYNELSKYEVKLGQELFKHLASIITPLQKINVIFDIGDAKELPNRLCDFTGNVDIIHVQNVEHFMNPAEHQQFAKALLEMTCQSGYLHLLAHTIPTNCGVKGNPFFDLYIQNKKKSVLYPMFLKIEKKERQLGGKYKNRQFFLRNENMSTIVVSMPEENEICTSSGYAGEKGYVIYQNEQTEYYTVHQNNLLNYFTPTIYKNAYTKAAKENGYSVEQVEALFIDNEGTFFSKEFKNDQNLCFALSIFQKM